MKPSSDKDDVSSALSHLTDTLDEEKDLLNEEAVQAMKDGEYDTATALIQFTKRLQGFQTEVEALVEKWEELAAARNGATPQVKHIVIPRTIQIKRPEVAPQLRQSSYKGITDSTAHCFHVLDVIEEMGGVAKNQDLTVAVNKRIKMLYPQFKQVKALLTHKGWTKNNGSKHTLEISGKGITWLHSQKAQVANAAAKAQDAAMPKPHDAPPPTPAEAPAYPIEDESGPFI